MSRAITVRRSAAALLLAGLAVLTASPAIAQPASLVGRWDGVVVVNGVEVPFPFEIAIAGPVLQGSFFNGERRITSTAVTSDGPRTAFRFEQYAATLQTVEADGRLSGCLLYTSDAADE